MRTQNRLSTSRHSNTIHLSYWKQLSTHIGRHLRLPTSGMLQSSRGIIASYYMPGVRFSNVGNVRCNVSELFHPTTAKWLRVHAGNFLLYRQHLPIVVLIWFPTIRSRGCRDLRHFCKQAQPIRASVCASFLLRYHRQAMPAKARCRPSVCQTFPYRPHVYHVRPKWG